MSVLERQWYVSHRLLCSVTILNDAVNSLRWLQCRVKVLVSRYFQLFWKRELGKYRTFLLFLIHKSASIFFIIIHKISSGNKIASCVLCIKACLKSQRKKNKLSSSKNYKSPFKVVIYYKEQYYDFGTAFIKINSNCTLWIEPIFISQYRIFAASFPLQWMFNAFHQDKSFP